jgi:glycosyltransferase involved in cell wall biosynthesis
MRVCVLAYKFYENAPRVMLFANELVRRGDSVDVISLGRPGQPPTETIRGVRIYRIQQRTRDERGAWSHLSRILAFFIRSATVVTTCHLRKSYDLIQVFSVPDFLVFAALIPHFLGTPILLDIYDIVPELYSTKFGVEEKSIVFRLLVQMEKFSVRLADYVTVPNDVWRYRLVSRSTPREKCSVIYYCADPEIFFPRPRSANERFTMVYHGSLSAHQDLDLAIRAFVLIKGCIPEVQFEIFGEGPEESRLKKLVEDLSLRGRITIHPPLPAEDISKVIANCDLGIATRRTCLQFADEACNTKIIEFMAVGVPVIATRTKADQGYLSDSVVQFVASGDAQQLADTVIMLIRDRDRRKELVINASEFIAKKGWASRRTFLKVVDDLVSKIESAQFDDSSLQNSASVQGRSPLRPR